MNTRQVTVAQPPVEQEDPDTGLLYRWTGGDVEVIAPGQALEGDGGEVRLTSAAIVGLQTETARTTVHSLLADWKFYTGLPHGFGLIPLWDSNKAPVSGKDSLKELSLRQVRNAVWARPEPAQGWARPILRWAGNLYGNPRDQWEIWLASSANAYEHRSLVGPLAVASWNDLEQIENLAEQLEDREYWISLAALQYPEETAKLKESYEKTVAWNHSVQVRQGASMAMHVEIFGPGTDNRVNVRRVAKTLRENFSHIATEETGLKGYASWPAGLTHVDLHASINSAKTTRVAEIIDLSNWIADRPGQKSHRSRRIALQDNVRAVLEPIGYTCVVTTNGHVIIARSMAILKRYFSQLLASVNREKVLAL